MSKPLLAMILATTLLSAGCGTLFNKKTVHVKLDDGVTVDGSGASGYTAITQNEDHTVSYPDGSTCTIESGISAGYFVLDLFLTGAIGIIVDAVTGGWKISKSDCRGVSRAD